MCAGGFSQPASCYPALHQCVPLFCPGVLPVAFLIPVDNPPVSVAASRAEQVSEGTSRLGTPTRLSGTAAAAHAPFLWQAGLTPPTAPTETNRLQSQDGQDLYVEIDCNSLGDCSSGVPDQPHLMIYNSSFCPPEDPWFNVVTGDCR